MSLIKNKEELSTNNLRRNALDILEAGLEAINTEKILKSKIVLENDGSICIEGTGFNCGFYERIYFIGIGKCAFDGAKTIEEILGEKLTDGVVIDVKGGILKKMKVFEGTHPYPSEGNITATKQILEMIKGVTERDLVLVLISGGGSSLLCLPHEMNCETLVEITRRLTEKGADIFELNTVRKHFSEIQGGGLAKILYPAPVVSLVFSDVLGNDLGMVASGPTVLDTTTIEDAEKILNKYDISISSLDQGTGQVKQGVEFFETPKDPKYFKNVKNCLVCSNEDALEAMKAKAESLGFKSEIISNVLSGNAREVGKKLALKDMGENFCLLFGGETTVEVKGNGQGGRNQELALSALPHLSPSRVLISSASDGWDNTDHAGALVDFELFQKAGRASLDPEEFLERNDSYNFFKQVSDGAISTGRLGSNVSDLVIIVNKD